MIEELLEGTDAPRGLWRHHYAVGQSDENLDAFFAHCKQQLEPKIEDNDEIEEDAESGDEFDLSAIPDLRCSGGRSLPSAPLFHVDSSPRAPQSDIIPALPGGGGKATVGKLLRAIAALQNPHEFSARELRCTRSRQTKTKFLNAACNAGWIKKLSGKTSDTLYSVTETFPIALNRRNVST